MQQSNYHNEKDPQTTQVDSNYDDEPVPENLPTADEIYSQARRILDYVI